MDALERCKMKYEVYNTENEKHAILNLRQRADVAEAIRDCYKAGHTRQQVAKTLGIDPTRVTRLVQGNYNAAQRDSEAHVSRTESNYRRQEPEPPPESPEPTQRVQMGPAYCRYCGEQAIYAVEWEDGKTVYVCKKHKPPDGE
jgi:hypothetical protein